MNNFVDGDRTDAMRFFVGEVSPEDYFRARSDLSRMKREQPLPTGVYYLPAMLFMVIAVLVFSLLSYRGASDGQLLAFMALCLLSIALLVRLIFHYGDAYVNKPVTSPFKPRVREPSF